MLCLGRDGPAAGRGVTGMTARPRGAACDGTTAAGGGGAVVTGGVETIAVGGGGAVVGRGVETVAAEGVGTAGSCAAAGR